MPAQSPHLLENWQGEAWFDLTPGGPLTVPMWGTFDWSQLRRFRDPGR